jgi:hypothetical protein
MNNTPGVPALTKVGKQRENSCLAHLPQFELMNGTKEQMDAQQTRINS